MSETAYKSFEVEDGKLKRIFSRNPDVEGSNFSRQTFPITYEANGYVDIVRSENIVQNGKLHGSNVKAFLTERAYEIDQESDLEYIQYLVQKEPKYLKLLGIQIL
jgi:N-acylneuraminate cytidylyltransferase